MNADMQQVQAWHGTCSSLTGNMLDFQASDSISEERFSALYMHLWHLPCQHTDIRQLVYNISACWLIELGHRHA